MSMPLCATDPTCPVDCERLEARLLDVLRSALFASPRLVAVTIPAPLLSPEQVFAYLPTEPAYHFASGDAQGDIGLGSVVTFQGDTLDGLQNIEQKAGQILLNCFEAGIDAAARPPRFCGGFAFESSPSPDGPWRSFPRVWFQLPRFRYLTDSHRATLTLLTLPEELATTEQRHGWVDRVLELQRALSHSPKLPQTTSRVIARKETPSRQEWLGLVTRAREAMKNGFLEKVVLAREISLSFDTAPSISQMLERLTSLAPETTRFALRRGSCTFLGATPERLVMRLGSEIRTEALAGSIRATDTGAADQLFHSDKDRHEHHLVVEEIERKLCSLGARAERSPHPQIRQLRQVLHLFTPITARLLGPPHVLTLAAKLHPTPAVGGVPEPAARQFIRHHEGFERGFYAGAIGWFDAAGDGEFLVALRSGLLEGNTFRLYAGAGIVSDSDPEREFDETQLKFESLLDALNPSPSHATDPNTTSEP